MGYLVKVRLVHQVVEIFHVLLSFKAFRLKPFFYFRAVFKSAFTYEVFKFVIFTVPSIALCDNRVQDSFAFFFFNYVGS